jgi:hypothetical protein
VFIAQEFNSDENIDIPEWTMIDDSIEAIKENLNDHYFEHKVSAVEVSLILLRRIDYYNRFVFIPTIFLVFISYSSFYISHLATPARTMLGVIPILAMFT